MPRKTTPPASARGARAPFEGVVLRDGKPTKDVRPMEAGEVERYLNRYHDIDGGRLALDAGRELRCGDLLIRKARKRKAPAKAPKGASDGQHGPAAGQAQQDEDPPADGGDGGS